MPHTTRTQVCGCGVPSRGQDGTGRVWRRRAGRITPSIRRPAGVICDSAVACGTFRQLAQCMWSWRVGSCGGLTRSCRRHIRCLALVCSPSARRVCSTAHLHTRVITPHTSPSRRPTSRRHQPPKEASRSGCTGPPYARYGCQRGLVATCITCTACAWHMHHTHSMCTTHA